MDDIIAGMEGKFLLEENRALAILAAVSSMEEGDWLVVAGKGHENYQIIGTEKKHFSDVEEVLKAVKVC
jgi:UDP-N-acetylmuramoyl-L-alanyl-D-glutamate--2,6-diaminopimelate ligase